MADLRAVPRLPAARRDKKNCSSCLKHDFVGVRVDFSDYAMSVLAPNVFETVQVITKEFGHFSASRRNLRGLRNPQPVVRTCL